MSIEMTQDTLDWIMEQLEQNRYKTELLENKIRKNVFTQLEQHTHRIDLLRNDSTIENRRVNLAHEKIEALENRIEQIDTDLATRIYKLENKTDENNKSIVILTRDNEAIEFVIQKIQVEILKLESTDKEWRDRLITKESNVISFNNRLEFLENASDAHEERLSELESHTTVDSDYIVRGKIQELQGHFNLLENTIKLFKKLSYEKFDKLEGKVDDLASWMKGQTETQFNLEEKYRTLLSNDKSQYSRDEKLREWIKHLENKISCDINKYAESLNDEHDGGPKWRDDLNFGQALDLLIKGWAKEISCWDEDYVVLSLNQSTLLIYQAQTDEWCDFRPDREMMLKRKWRVIE